MKSIILYALFFVVLTSTQKIYCSETDSWTYRDIPLNDSGDILTSIINKHFQDAITSINAQITASNNKHIPDNMIEQQIAKTYFETFFYNDHAQDAFSIFEVCIDTGRCEQPWQDIERIALRTEESVYYQANYSAFSKRFLASQIQACGIRFSTDKLTHMFKDGFNFYNYARQNPKFSIDDVALYSKTQERFGMGRLTTGVISHADITANLAGFQLLEDVFSQYITRDIDTQLLAFSPINLCHYLSDDFDEAINPNEYVASIKKVKALKKAISHARTIKTHPEQQTKIIQRQATFTRPSLLEKIKVLIYVSVFYFFIEDYKFTVDIYTNNAPKKRVNGDFSFKKSHALLSR